MTMSLWLRDILGIGVWIVNQILKAACRIYDICKLSQIRFLDLYDINKRKLEFMVSRECFFVVVMLLELRSKHLRYRVWIATWWLNAILNKRIWSKKIFWSCQDFIFIANFFIKNEHVNEQMMFNVNESSSVCLESDW